MKNKIITSIIFLTSFYTQFVFAENTKPAELPAYESVTPESFTSALDSLLYSYYARHARQGNCDNFSSINIVYPDSIYLRRLSQLPYEVNMPFNQTVRGFIELYAGRRRKQVENMLGLGKYYFPIFEDILVQYGVPLEFKYLPVIESAMSTGAVSHAGAAGLWQFMPSTGKMYGLEVNSLVDERRDPVKSTHAAAKYLKELFRIYNDWHLAIAAYNCGPGNINRAIRRSGGKRDYWSLYPYLPRETRSYVPIFIAANYVMNYYTAHNLCPVELDLPLYTDTVRITQRIHFTDVAQMLNLPVEELRALNPQYRRDIVPGSQNKPYTLKLPTSYAAKFDTSKQLIYAEAIRQDSIRQRSGGESLNKTIAKSKSQSTGKARYYRVRSGDNLGSIARRHGVTVAQLKRWNNLRSSHIRAGRRLVVQK